MGIGVGVFHWPDEVAMTSTMWYRIGAGSIPAIPTRTSRPEWAVFVFSKPLEIEGFNLAEIGKVVFANVGIFL